MSGRCLELRLSSFTSSRVLPAPPGLGWPSRHRYLLLAGCIRLLVPHLKPAHNGSPFRIFSTSSSKCLLPFGPSLSNSLCFSSFGSEFHAHTVHSQARFGYSAPAEKHEMQSHTPSPAQCQHCRMLPPAILLCFGISGSDVVQPSHRR